MKFAPKLVLKFAPKLVMSLFVASKTSKIMFFFHVPPRRRPFEGCFCPSERRRRKWGLGFIGRMGRASPRRLTREHLDCRHLAGGDIEQEREREESERGGDAGRTGRKEGRDWVFTLLPPTPSRALSPALALSLFPISGTRTAADSCANISNIYWFLRLLFLRFICC